MESDSCPTGTLCVDKSGPGSHASVAVCVDENTTCGGPDHRACPDGQYCELTGVFCPRPNCPSSIDPCEYANKGGLGTCRPLPAEGACTSGGQVCGCDDVTYDNECSRQRAQVALAHTGGC